MSPLPPGSMGLPWLGETLAFMKDPFGFFEERYERHGEIYKTRILGDPLLCFVGPEAIAYFYGDTFTRERASPPQLQELLNADATPFIDGSRHRLRRSLMMNAFSPEALAGYQPTIERVVGRHLERWQDGRERRGVDELGSMCFAIANTLFLGADPDHDDRALSADFDALAAGALALPIELPFTTYGRAIAARDRLRAEVAKALDAYELGSASHALERLLAAKSDSGDTLGKDEIAVETLHFFFAAYAALQATLCALMVALARHPKTSDRVADDVKKACPTGDIGDRIVELLSVQHLCREVRRCHTTVPITFFGSVRKDGEYRGFRVPEGWKAVAVLHSTMHDERLFPDPERFDPERFADDSAPPAYVPHGAGSMSGHRCAGEALADRILETFTARMLRDYRVELPAQDLSFAVAGLVRLPRDGVRMVVKKR